MAEYVLVYVRSMYGKVLLIRKNKPSWQKGLLNLVGGKVEPGETPAEAAKRELEEETGIIAEPTQYGRIVCTDSIIYCFSCEGPDDEKMAFYPRECETETIEHHQWEQVKNDPTLIPNLRLIIPLLHAQSGGWDLIEEGFEEFKIKLNKVI